MKWLADFFRRLFARPPAVPADPDAIRDEIASLQTRLDACKEALQKWEDEQKV